MGKYVVAFAMTLLAALASGGGEPAVALLDLAKDGRLWEEPAGRAYEETAAADGSVTQRLPGPCLLADDLPGGEILVRFREGDRLRQRIQVMIYNKGDDGPCTPRFFSNTLARAIAALADASGAEGVRKPVPSNSRLIDMASWEWRGAKTLYRLDVASSGKGQSLVGEFIRLRMVPAAAPAPAAAVPGAAARPGLAAAADAFGRSTRQDRVDKLDLKANLAKKGTGVAIEGIPMVDQGQKGYCVAAVMARLLEYYGLGSMDQHELAAAMGTSADGGTSLQAMKETMEKCGHKFGLRMKSLDELDLRDYERLIKEYNRAAKRSGAPKIEAPRGVVIAGDAFWLQVDPDTLLESRAESPQKLKAWLDKMKLYIDRGVPVIWSVMCGMLPEPGVGRGGHMRLVVGYDEAAGLVYYSDTWGPGHECKPMSLADAYAITQARFVLMPL